MSTTGLGDTADTADAADTADTADTTLVGIFIGGQGSRMGGQPKGLLTRADGTTLIENAIAETRLALPEANIVLVGQHPAYQHVQLEQLSDDPPGSGPLGGLHALLQRQRQGSALALACDLPFLDGKLIARLLTTTPRAAACAPRPRGTWQPLCARYSAEHCLPILTQLLTRHGNSVPRFPGPRRLLTLLGDTATELPLDPTDLELLQDWDTPADVARGGGQLPNS